ncbi:uncharacterized protein BKCO1_1000165 [Diplodia corticola]|uniref:Uncharacterized protein n=1 Tax=Diplodia corticola TaxID=236234 RepID=A0A1J9SJP2_9PEZI|nr:uncharacterized protein BKCO1_1000165 [Diplodia corticola]OJD40559.1 hypothetical protein BKCO1_1000165 [Diplodia corticola]
MVISTKRDKCDLGNEWTVKHDIAPLEVLSKDKSGHYAFVTTQGSMYSKLLKTGFAKNVVFGISAQNSKRFILKESDLITNETSLALTLQGFSHLAEELQKPEWKGFEGTQKELLENSRYKMWDRDGEEDPYYNKKELNTSPVSVNFDALLDSSSSMKALFRLIGADTTQDKFVLGSSNTLINATVAEGPRQKKKRVHCCPGVERR